MLFAALPEACVDDVAQVIPYSAHTYKHIHTDIEIYRHIDG